MATVNNSVANSGDDNADALKATGDPAVNSAIVDNLLGATEDANAGVDRTDAADATETIRLIPYGKLKFDHGRNPRRPERYTAEGEAGVKARSLLARGLISPLLVSERENGDIVILQGHIRHAGIGLLRTVGLPAGTPKAEKPAVEPNPDFMSKVRCIVKRGLTLQGEMDLVMDHGESFPLDKREKYGAAVRMLRMGFSQDLTAKKLGFKSRGPLAKLSNVSQMPQIVEDLYLADPKAEDYKDLTDQTIDELFKAYNADRKAGRCRVKHAGPEFTKVLDKFLANGPAIRNKSVPRTVLVALAGTIKDLDLRELIEGIAEGDTDLMNSALERVMIRLELERNGGFGLPAAPPIEPTVVDEEEDEPADD